MNLKDILRMLLAGEPNLDAVEPVPLDMARPNAREFFMACPRSHKTEDFVCTNDTGDVTLQRKITPAAAALLDEVQGELDQYLRRKTVPRTTESWDVMDDILADYEADVIANMAATDQEEEPHK